MGSIFVGGTDTSVGKTLVCGLLLAYLRKQGIEAGYQKWVSTGDTTGAADLDFCLSTAGMTAVPEEIDLQVPYRFSFPASPHLAAELEGKTVDPEIIVDRWRRLRARYDILLVEGVGGLLVPLRRDLLLADLLARLVMPTLIVARSGLGTLNHTLLTLEALRTRAVPILGVVFSDAESQEDQMLVADNMRTIAEIGRVEVFGRLRRVPAYREARLEESDFEATGQAVLHRLRQDNLVTKESTT
ncbi:MAG: dethiobiotin synthase [Deltaproteobacteria bacterium RIFOXYD12_FULL_57_12]|nr:MAG: dethiobiotin synthase [Deltaproteobacteria bacterium RIFOXYD12_FULL_57_12]